MGRCRWQAGDAQEEHGNSKSRMQIRWVADLQASNSTGKTWPVDQPLPDEDDVGGDVKVRCGICADVQIKGCVRADVQVSSSVRAEVQVGGSICADVKMGRREAAFLAVSI